MSKLSLYRAMKKKRSILLPARQHKKFGSNLVILFSLVLFLLAFLVLHFHTTLQSVFSFDQSSSSRAFIDDTFKGTPKIAFLFLARRNLPLDFLWGAFFKDVDMEMFSIYVHSEPGFVFNESNTRSALFYGRQLNNSIQVAWGESSMIEAERLLFEAALDDPANQRFALLSDSCIPLYNFSYVYCYLMSSQKSFVDSFVDVKDNRYSLEMSPIIPKEKWRKGSQWISLIRKHAQIVVDDDIVFPVFRKFCQRWPPADLTNRRQMLRFFGIVQNIQSSHNCIPDEHYAQTLLQMGGLQNEIEPRTLTYTLWNQYSDAGKMSTWHPFQFNYADASPQLIQEIKNCQFITPFDVSFIMATLFDMWQKDINRVNYEFHDQKELCHVDVTTAPCFLFARKFTPAAALRLLTERSIDLQ